MTASAVAPGSRAFDAELYLRLVGERMLLEHRTSPHRAPWDSPLTAATEALVAVGAITAQAADVLLDDHDLAVALRSRVNEPGQRRLLAGPRPRTVVGSGPPLGPRRVVACDARIERTDLTLFVRYVSLSEDGARIGISGRGRARDSRSPHQAHLRIGRGLPNRKPRLGPGLRQVTLTDDRGGTANANFSGMGTDEGWHGQLEADQPLAVETRWIELDGVRIPLIDDEAPVDISVERLPDEDPARRILRRLAAPEQPHRSSIEAIEPAIEALVACGALPIDDPGIEDARAIVAVTGFGPMRAAQGARPLPEPWRSMVTRRGLGNGPQGSLIASAVTPQFDGISVALTNLESTEEGWAIEVDVVPEVVMAHHGFGAPITGRRRLEWWARDDRGNHYLGQVGTWSSRPGGGSGDVSFWPALDPRASELAVMPTAETERAVIRLPLAWNRGGGDRDEGDRP
jgi:hypothetical protein